MNRVTVSQLFQTEEPTIVRQNCSISSVFFTDDHIYLIETNFPQIIKKMTIKNFKTIENIPLSAALSQSHINSLTEIASLIVFAVDGSNDLHYINAKQQLIRLNSHLQQINQVICYRNQIATCSDDLTVRIWNCQQGQLIQSNTKHVYCGHTGKVVCFQKYDDFLISGSSDHTVIFWRKDEKHCSFNSTAPVKNILVCSQSNQFLVFSQNGEISVLNWGKIVKNKTADLNRIIKYISEEIETLKSSFVYCNEIDDSFVWFNDGNSIVFVEINLGEIITKKEVCDEKEGKVVNMKSIGRMLLYGKKNDSMFLLRF